MRLGALLHTLKGTATPSLLVGPRVEILALAPNQKRPQSAANYSLDSNFVYSGLIKTATCSHLYPISIQMLGLQQVSARLCKRKGVHGDGSVDCK